MTANQPRPFNAARVKVVAQLMLVALAVGCCNPVADEKIEALGAEVEGVEPGEHHRPGQPCVLCHSKAGGADPHMAIGGTIFADQRSFLPVEGAEVVIYDTLGDVYTMTSNCIGNFYLEDTDLIPQFPLAVEVRCPTYNTAGERLEAPKVVSMNSWISRDGSCASCHSLSGTQVDSTGWIFCNDPSAIAANPYPEVAPTCPGKAPQEAGEAAETSP
jgi:hypothetical protein